MSEKFSILHENEELGYTIEIDVEGEDVQEKMDNLADELADHAYREARGQIAQKFNEDGFHQRTRENTWNFAERLDFEDIQILNGLLYHAEIEAKKDKIDPKLDDIEDAIEEFAVTLGEYGKEVYDQKGNIGQAVMTVTDVFAAFFEPDTSTYDLDRDIREIEGFDRLKEEYGDFKDKVRETKFTGYPGMEQIRSNYNEVPNQAVDALGMMFTDGFPQKRLSEYERL